MMTISQWDLKMARDMIAAAKKELNKDDFDSHLAGFMLRDLVATKEAGLSKLAWAMYGEYPHKNDVLGFIEYLEKFLDNN